MFTILLELLGSKPGLRKPYEVQFRLIPDVPRREVIINNSSLPWWRMEKWDWLRGVTLDRWSSLITPSHMSIFSELMGRGTCNWAVLVMMWSCPSLTSNCLGYSLFQEVIYLSSQFFIINFINSCLEEPPGLEGWSGILYRLVAASQVEVCSLWTDDHREILTLTGVSSPGQEVLISKTKVITLYPVLITEKMITEAIWPVTKLMVDNKRS